MNDDRGTLPFVIPPGDDAAIVELIESWLYRGPATSWDEIVGHARQKDRCRQLVALLQRDGAELDRLRLRRGRGLVISGPAGTGKTLLARATATAAGRPVIIPPTSELTESLIARLYAQLAKMESSVVILDEAESLIGHPYLRTTQPSSLRALLAALDGLNTDAPGPLTIALTTSDPSSLDDAATRPGRLAPTLSLGPPTPTERRHLLERALAGLPISGSIDLDRVVARTGRWTGAQLVGAVEEACARSVLDGSEALGEDLLLEVVAEGFLVLDDGVRVPELTRAVAVHEAAHALCAEIMWPGSVAAIEIQGGDGHTHLSDAIDRGATVDGLRSLVVFALSGRVGEELILGSGAVGRDDNQDAAVATRHAMTVIGHRLSYAPSLLEGGMHDSPQGAERMRAELHAAVVEETESARRRAVELLAPRLRDLERLADALERAEDARLSGKVVREVLANTP